MKPKPDLIDLVNTNDFAFYWQFVLEHDLDFYLYHTQRFQELNVWYVYGEMIKPLEGVLTPKGKIHYRADFVRFIKAVFPDRYRYAREVFCLLKTPKPKRSQK